MLIDLLPELEPGGDYENIITAIDVFSRYSSVSPIFYPRAVETAKVITDIMTRHAYRTTIMITDRGSVLVAKVIHEKANVLGITLHHATTKHAKSMGVLERTHVIVKTSQTNELYLPLASTLVLKRKQEMIYVPLDFDNKLTIDASVDSRVYANSIFQNQTDTIKQKTPKNISRINDPLNSQLQAAND